MKRLSSNGRTGHTEPRRRKVTAGGRSNGARRGRGDEGSEGQGRTAPHAFWKGSLNFGLVDIPVALRPATKRDELGFSLLDRRDFAPVGYRHYNKSTGDEVQWSQIVRGYEYEPDEYVVLSDEELAAANVKATQTIEILEFVDRAEIPPMFFDTPYFVEPLKQGSYALLRAALERTGKVGIARVVLRTRQHLAAVLVRDSVLMLDLLRYEDELRAPSDLSVPGESAKQSGLKENEIQMAERLIAGMTGSWKPSQYKDEYREDVMALVKRKVKSGQIHEIVEPRKPAAEAPRPGVVDLMPLLKRSLEQATHPKRREPSESKRSRARSHSRSA